MPKERQWMPMYWGDYFGGTQLFNNCAEHGAYLLLIAYCWHYGKLPAEDEARRKIAKATPRQWKLMRGLVSSKFDDEGRNQRCSEELAYAAEKSRAMSANAMHRHHNGNAAAYTPTPTPTGLRKKPRHGQKDRAGRRVWCDIGTTEFDAYAQDYRQSKGSEPILNWSGSGAWFNWHGETH